MSWNTLGPQITTLIDNNKTSLGIQEVKAFPTMSFTGYPSVSIYPSDNENEFLTTSENERIYAWRIIVFYDVANGGIENGYEALREVIDGLLDLLDGENGAGTHTVGVSMPANYTFLNLLAIPNEWGLTEDEELLMGTLTVKVRVSVDIV